MSTLKSSPAFGSFSVPDMAAAKKFYAETLGVEAKETPEGLELALAGGGRVFIYHSATNKPADFTILNFSVDDLETVVGELAAKGVRMERYDMPGIKTDERGIAHNDGGGMGPRKMAWCKDPAGNIIGLLQEK